MAIASDFDEIADPYSTYFQSRRLKMRRNRTLGCLLLASLLTMMMFWNRDIAEIPWSSVKSAGSKISSSTFSKTDPVSSSPSQPYLNSDGTAKKQFHLLIANDGVDANTCKTVLSAFLLDYPPPTLINWQRYSKADEPGDSNGAKLRSVSKYLHNHKHVQDDDLALIVEGSDVWFQLPADLMIKRYEDILRFADERAKRRYGTETRLEPGEGSSEISSIPKYISSVVFGAEDECWPNDAYSAACAGVPASTLPKNAYHSTSLEDRRPRFLNSGSVIGPVSSLLSIFDTALDRASTLTESRSYENETSHYLLSTLYGEQEYNREADRAATLSTGGRWLSWLANALGTSDYASNLTNITVFPSPPNTTHEFGITLDYASLIFQHLNDKSSSEVQPFSYESTDTPLSLPIDLLRTPFPISGGSASTYSIPTNLSWSTVPLLTNTQTFTISSLLISPSPSSLYDELWFHPYSRNLLRMHLSAGTSASHAKESLNGGSFWWDMRGGRGGVWTDSEEWYEWKEICRGYEDDIFGDGRGVWGKESDGGFEDEKVYNSFGRLLMGEKDDKPGKKGSKV